MIVYVKTKNDRIVGIGNTKTKHLTTDIEIPDNMNLRYCLGKKIREVTYKY